MIAYGASDQSTADDIHALNIGMLKEDLAAGGFDCHS